MLNYSTTGATVQVKAEEESITEHRAQVLPDSVIPLTMAVNQYGSTPFDLLPLTDNNH